MTVPLDAGGQGSGGEPSSSVRRDVGTKIEGQYAFTADNVSEYARAAQDFNPLHHDPDVAARSRFGMLIASAAQSTGVFTSLLATYFAPSGQALGLEFAFKLKRAVKVGVNAQMRWTIVSSVFSDKLGGDLIDVEGTMTDDGGAVLMTGTGRLVYLKDQGTGPSTEG